MVRCVPHCCDHLCVIVFRTLGVFPDKEIIRDSAHDGEGGGPGVCRYDSAFGRQVTVFPVES
jgi:hypothetical protein